MVDCFFTLNVTKLTSFFARGTLLCARNILCAGKILCTRNMKCGHCLACIQLPKVKLNIKHFFFNQVITHYTPKIEHYSYFSNVHYSIQVLYFQLPAHIQTFLGSPVNNIRAVLR